MHHALDKNAETFKGICKCIQEMLHIISSM